MAPAKERPATKTIATNREARHEYFVLEALETGVELKGTEVKSLRAGGVNLKDSWVDIEDGELLVKGMHITPYDHGNIFNQDPLRVRRLLAHKTEIRRLHQQCKLQGYTLVPLSLYFKHGRVKMEVGLCKGKKLYDKRADAAKRDAKRSIDRAVKSNGKYYIVDLGLRNHILPRRKYDLGFSIENIVYLELLRRGYRVFIGKVGTTEVDFVAEQQGVYTYFQVTADMAAEETFNREIAPLKNIKDNYEKIILTLDRVTLGNYEGIEVINLLDWLLNVNQSIMY